MSSEAEHIAIANRNQAVLDFLLQDPATCAGWVAVVAFYKSLHVVEAIFSRGAALQHCHNHHDRLNRLKSTRQYQPLFGAFRTLWTASVVARYLDDRSTVPAGHGRFYSCFEDYLPVADLRPNLLDRYLQAFEGMAVQMLPPNGCGLS